MNPKGCQKLVSRKEMILSGRISMLVYRWNWCAIAIYVLKGKASTWRHNMSYKIVRCLAWENIPNAIICVGASISTPTVFYSLCAPDLPYKCQRLSLSGRSRRHTHYIVGYGLGFVCQSFCPVAFLLSCDVLQPYKLIVTSSQTLTAYSRS